jgi:GDSL-like Lipase/Acylhydrolase family
MGYIDAEGTSNLVNRWRLGLKGGWLKYDLSSNKVQLRNFADTGFIQLDTSCYTSVVAGLDFGQTFYDSFTAAGAGILGHTPELGTWIDQYGCAAKLKTGGGRLYSISNVDCVCRSAVAQSGTNRIISVGLVNTSGSVPAGGESYVVGWGDGVTTNVGQFNGYLIGLNGANIKIYRGDGTTLNANPTGQDAAFSGGGAPVSFPSFVATNGAIQTQAVHQLTVMLNVGSSLTFKIFWDSTYIGQYVDNAPIVAAVYPSMYTQGNAAYTDSSNVGYHAISESAQMINIFSAGDSISTSDYLDTGEVGSSRTILTSLYDAFKGLAVVGNNAVSGRGIQANNGYAGSAINATTVYAGQANVNFAKNIAIVFAGTNDFLTPNSAPATVLSALETYATQLKTAGSSQAGAVKFDDVYAVTPLHANNANSHNASVDTYNQSLRASAIVKTIDLTTDPNLGVALPSAGAYFVDGVHPTKIISVGLISGIMQAAVNPSATNPLLFPTQSGNSGKALITNGTNVLWGLPFQGTDITGFTGTLIGTQGNGSNTNYIGFRGPFGGANTFTNIDTLASSFIFSKPILDLSMIGAPTVPVPATTDNSTIVANTAFVQNKAYKIDFFNAYNFVNLPPANTNWYSAYKLTGTLSTIVASASTNTSVRLYRYVSERAGVIDALALECATLLASSGYRLAIYRSTAAGLPTGVPVLATGQLDGSVSTTMRGSPASVTGGVAFTTGTTLTAGEGEVLWFGLWTSASATLTVRGISMVSVGSSYVVGANALPSANTLVGSSSIRSVTGTYSAAGAFPDAAASTPVVNIGLTMPNVLLRYAS